MAEPMRKRFQGHGSSAVICYVGLGFELIDHIRTQLYYKREFVRTDPRLRARKSANLALQPLLEN